MSRVLKMKDIDEITLYLRERTASAVEESHSIIEYSKLLRARYLMVKHEIAEIREQLKKNSSH